MSVALSERAMLAVDAVLDIALHGLHGPVQAADITARQGIPKRSLEPVLQKLTRAGILGGVRGPKGGYRLARERRRITVADILREAFRTVQGEEDGEDGLGSELSLKVLRPLWGEMETRLLDELDQITLETLVARARAAGVKAAEPPADFTI